jgi:biopolymer transport protein ExbD
VVGDILTALTRYEMVVGALVAGALLLGFGLLNKWQRWWVSSDLLASEKARADEARQDAEASVMRAHAEAELSVTRAHADADAKVISMREAMEKRIQEHRDDGRDRALQVRQDSQAELDRLLKIVDAIQREVESWRTAFHLADQANREEDDARWDRIEASLDVTKQFIIGVQRFSLAPAPELEMRGDGRAGSDVV